MTSRAADTRRVYRIEESWAKEEWPMAKLRALANRIWQKEAPANWKKFPPRIVAGRGMMYNGRLLSYCLGRSYIELTRTQRDPKVLIHELTHALVNGWTCGHNKTFQAKMVELLLKYKIRCERKP